VEPLNADQWGLFISLLWGLWNITNRCIFEGKKEEVGLTTIRYADKWRNFVVA